MRFQRRRAPHRTLIYVTAVLPGSEMKKVYFIRTVTLEWPLAGIIKLTPHHLY